LAGSTSSPQGSGFQSLGGGVIAHYLLNLHDPFDITLPPIGHMVTVASPFEGSDLARTGLALLDVLLPLPLPLPPS
jgi:hypothetical protein